MGTVVKALSLLDLFSEARPELGLSEIARLSGNDKATTRRLLVALCQGGLVEQVHQSRAYRIGPGVLRLAQLREAHLPIEAIVTPILARLSEEVNETAHFSLASADVLCTVGFREPGRAHRVRLERGERLPFHATASGIAFLAFSPAVAEATLKSKLRRHTKHTVVDADALRARIEQARKDGFAISKEGYEDGVFGLAAPMFDRNNHAIGSVAVAAPLARVDAKAQTLIRKAVSRAASDIHVALGGTARRAMTE